MARIRVLVVDDSVVFRMLVPKILADERRIEIAGTAPNGRIALEKIPLLNPDLITLDVEMPEMDGLEFLSTLRRTYPRLPVLMLSSVTEHGASATLEALARGATDYVTKPSFAGTPEAARESLRQQLVEKITALCAIRLEDEAPLLEVEPITRLELPARRSPMRFEEAAVAAIGASTGGPDALSNVLAHLPSGFPIPVVIAQHMPPIFTRHLAQRLSAKCQIPVMEAVSGTPLEAGKAYIAPGDYHMVAAIRNGSVYIDTNQDPPENFCRPSVDVLFRSVAGVYGPRVLAVVLTGMGNDGLRGCRRIRQAGGYVMTQDEATSVVWGMPGAVAKADLADMILPLDRIGPEILSRVARRLPEASLPTPGTGKNVQEPHGTL
jgi:two-component system chemotaxis response regulator CheB